MDYYITLEKKTQFLKKTPQGWEWNNNDFLKKKTRKEKQPSQKPLIAKQKIISVSDNIYSTQIFLVCYFFELEEDWVKYVYICNMHNIIIINNDLTETIYYY